MKTKQILAVLSVLALAFVGLAMIPGQSDADGGITTQAELIAAIADDSVDTITLAEDIDLTSTISVERNVTINLNGHNITGHDVRAIWVKSGDLIITGEGIISSERISNLSDSSSVIRVGNGSSAVAQDFVKSDANLMIGEDVVVSADYTYTVTVFGGSTNEILDVYGSIASTAAMPALSGNGDAWNAGTVINIHEGASIVSVNSAAIYHPNDGILNVDGDVFGNSAIEIKSGELNIGPNATIVCEDAISHERCDAGTSTTGYAIAAVENNAYIGNISVTIDGGTVVGPIDVVEDSEPTDEDATIDIYSGMFTKDVSNYLAEDCLMFTEYYIDEDNGNIITYYSVGPSSTAVASVGNDVFNDFATAAMCAIMSNRLTITMLGDTTMDSSDYIPEELDVPVVLKVQGGYRITIDTLALPIGMSIDLDETQFIVNDSIAIPEGSAFNGAINFGYSNTAVLTDLVAGTDGFIMSKGSIVISGNMDSGYMAIAGNAKISGDVDTNDAQILIQNGASMTIPSNSSLTGNHEIINRGSINVYGALANDVDNMGTVKVYSDAVIEGSEITGNVVEEVDVAIEPIDDMTVDAGTSIVIYLSAIPADARITVTGVDWLNIQGQRLTGTAPQTSGSHNITVTATIDGGSATEQFTITVVATEVEPTLSITPIDNISITAGGKVAISVATSIPDAVITIEGANWLTVQGHALKGTAPANAGTYTVTVKAASGNLNAQERFSINVLSAPAPVEPEQPTEDSDKKSDDHSIIIWAVAIILALVLFVRFVLIRFL